MGNWTRMGASEKGGKGSIRAVSGATPKSISPESQEAQSHRNYYVAPVRFKFDSKFNVKRPLGNSSTKGVNISGAVTEESV